MTNVTPVIHSACRRVGPDRVIRTMPVPAYVHELSFRKFRNRFIGYAF